MRLDEFMDKLKGLPPDARVCVAEIEEAFAVNIAAVDVIDTARAHEEQASGREAVELDNGNEKVVVIRW